MIKTIWQIWQSTDGYEDTTFPVTNPSFTGLILDDEGKPMKLIHEFVVTGDPSDIETVKRAFAYSNHFRHANGAWPEGCKPLKST